eukprot:1433858-Rhodomonas_salina.1
MVWPPERMVLALQVCRSLYLELPVHATSILLVSRGMEIAVSEQTLAEDLFCLSRHGLEVVLRCRGQAAGLMRAAALSKCKLSTPYLNLRGMTVGARPVEGIAGMLERSYAQCHPVWTPLRSQLSPDPSDTENGSTTVRVTHTRVWLKSRTNSEGGILTGCCGTRY